MTIRRFELHDPEENHKKFWEVSDPEGQGKGWIVTCRWGRIGTSGQERSFYFPDYGAADKFRCGKIDEKKGKGYLSIGNLIAKQTGLPVAVAQKLTGLVADGKPGPRTWAGALTPHCDVYGCDKPAELCDCIGCETGRTRVHLCGVHRATEDARSCHHLARCRSVHADPAPHPPDPEDPFSLPFD